MLGIEREGGSGCVATCRFHLYYNNGAWSDLKPEYSCILDIHSSRLPQVLELVTKACSKESTSADLELAQSLVKSDLPGIEAALLKGASVNGFLPDGNLPDQSNWDVQTSGYTPLTFKSDLPRFEDNSRALELLLKAGADLKTRSWDLNTPLHYAVTADVFNGALLLIKAGADINAQDMNGNTPLMVMLRNGSFEDLPLRLKLLLEFTKTRADLSLENDKGETLFSMISKLKDKKIAGEVEQLAVAYVGNEELPHARVKPVRSCH
jgi:ankyrin repeat protein